MGSTSNPCAEVLLFSKYLSEEILHCSSPVDMHSGCWTFPEGDITLLIELMIPRHSQTQQMAKVTLMLTDPATFLQDKTRALKDVLEAKLEEQQTQAAHSRASRRDRQGCEIFVFHSVFFGVWDTEGSHGSSWWYITVSKGIWSYTFGYWDMDPYLKRV